jgi:hypothetical protein
MSINGRGDRACQDANAAFRRYRAIERLGESADFSLSHGAVELAAEQALADIGTFEAEKAAKR